MLRCSSSNLEEKQQTTNKNNDRKTGELLVTTIMAQTTRLMAGNLISMQLRFIMQVELS